MNTASGSAVLTRIPPSLSLDSAPADALPVSVKCIFSTHYLLSLEQTWEQNEELYTHDLGV